MKTRIYAVVVTALLILSTSAAIYWNRRAEHWKQKSALGAWTLNKTADWIHLQATGRYAEAKQVESELEAEQERRNKEKK